MYNDDPSNTQEWKHYVEPPQEPDVVDGIEYGAINQIELYPWAMARLSKTLEGLGNRAIAEDSGLPGR